MVLLSSAVVVGLAVAFPPPVCTSGLFLEDIFTEVESVLYGEWMEPVATATRSRLESRKRPSPNAVGAFSVIGNPACSCRVWPIPYYNERRLLRCRSPPVEG